MAIFGFQTQGKMSPDKAREVRFGPLRKVMPENFRAIIAQMGTGKNFLGTSLFRGRRRGNDFLSQAA